MVGRYTLLELLGSGGTAEVYKSVHPELQRDVAVKVLYPKHTHDTGFVQRFRQEARTAAALVHPHIVQVYDFDVTADGLYFIVMQLVNGPSLETYLAEHPGPMALGQVCAYFRQIADALQFAHERGAVHRDLKPANVLIDGREQLYLSDFGFARLVGVDLHTRSSMTLGTPVYMAPEQIEGGDITAATDVYALGAVLYQMMTGRRPYENDNILLLILNKVEEPPPPPRQLNPAIPPECEKVILKAMSIDPASRYQTAAAMLAAFTAAIPATDPAAPIVIPPILTPQVLLSSSGNGREQPPTPPSPPPPSRHRRLWAALPLTLLFVILFGFYLRGQNLDNANGLSGAPATSTLSAGMMETAVPTIKAPTATKPKPTASSQPTSQPTFANQVVATTATASPSPTNTKTATATLTPTQTATATKTPTATRTPIPTVAATMTNTAVPPTPLPTSPPPTELPPPTQPPPTEVPPTEAPPTEAPTRTPPAPPTRTPPPPGP